MQAIESFQRQKGLQCPKGLKGGHLPRVCFCSTTFPFSPFGPYTTKKGHPFEMSFSIKVAMTYSPTNLCSTIGAVGLNFSVRDGKRWIPNAINRLNKGLMP